MNIGTRFLVYLSLAVSAIAATPRETPESAHGIFTGEIKPVVYVRDVEKSAPFYRDVLGFGFLGYAENEDGPFYAEMAAAEIKFGLHEPTTDTQQRMVGRQRLYVRVEDLPAHRARVVARGAEPGKTRVTDWMDMFIVRDPDGSEIVFAYTDPDRHPINPWSTKGDDADEPEGSDR